MYELSGLFKLRGVGLVVLRVGGEAVLVLGVGLDGDALWGGDHQVVIHHNTLHQNTLMRNPAGITFVSAKGVF